MLRSGRQGSLLPVLDLESELGGDYHVFAERTQCIANKFFVCKRAVHFCGIEERNAELHRLPKERNHLLFFFGRAITEAHPHAAAADSRDVQIAFSKFAFFHTSSFPILSFVV